MWVYRHAGLPPSGFIAMRVYCHAVYRDLLYGLGFSRVSRVSRVMVIVTVRVSTDPVQR